MSYYTSLSYIYVYRREGSPVAINSSTTDATPHRLRCHRHHSCLSMSWTCPECSHLLMQLRERDRPSQVYGQKWTGLCSREFYLGWCATSLLVLIFKEEENMFVTYAEYRLTRKVALILFNVNTFTSTFCKQIQLWWRKTSALLLNPPTPFPHHPGMP